jgi:hypothetical protein
MMDMDTLELKVLNVSSSTNFKQLFQLFKNKYSKVMTSPWRDTSAVRTLNNEPVFSGMGEFIENLGNSLPYLLHPFEPIAITGEN